MMNITEIHQRLNFHSGLLKC